MRIYLRFVVQLKDFYRKNSKKIKIKGHCTSSINSDIII